MEIPKRYEWGLVVGKFSPLHLGHEYLIHAALRACRHVVALSWSNPEYEGCPAPLRETWLRALFPQVTALVLDDARLESWRHSGVSPAVAPREGRFFRLFPGRSIPVHASHLPFRVPPNDAPESQARRFAGAVCFCALGKTVDAVFTSESYGDGFAAELTAYYREIRPGTPPVDHVCVDLSRRSVPISATSLRADVHGNRNFLSPVVYASFVKRVAFLGGESSGKSSLAEACAARFSTRFADEYGRELWTAQGGKLRYRDFARIARTQVAREEELAGRSHRVLFCDSTPLTTYFYSLHQEKRVDPEVQALAGRRYDLTILCAPDFPFVQDGTRKDEAFRGEQHRWYLQELERRGVPFVSVGGTLEARVGRVMELMKERGWI